MEVTEQPNAPDEDAKQVRAPNECALWGEGEGRLDRNSTTRRTHP